MKDLIINTKNMDLAQKALEIYQTFKLLPICSDAAWGDVYMLHIAEKLFAFKASQWPYYKKDEFSHEEIWPREYKMLERMADSGFTPTPFAFYDRPSSPYSKRSKPSKRCGNVNPIPDNAILMEFLVGKSLYQLEHQERFSPHPPRYNRKKVMDSFDKAMKAFEERDLRAPLDLDKRGNIILTPNSEVKIVDLGLCFDVTKNFPSRFSVPITIIKAKALIGTVLDLIKNP